jgi:hypothetical protein
MDDNNDCELDAIDPEILVSMILRYKLGSFGVEFFQNYSRQKKTLEKRASVKIVAF